MYNWRSINVNIPNSNDFHVLHNFCGWCSAPLHLRLGLDGGVGAGLGLDYVGISLDGVRLGRTLYCPPTTCLNYLSRLGKQLLRLLLDQLRLTRLARYQFDLLLRLGGGLDHRVLASFSWRLARHWLVGENL